MPTLDEQDIAMHAMRIPSTGITQSTEMQLRRRAGDQSEFPEVAFVFSKTGTAEVASDPMPPNVSDTFIILKPQDQWRSDEELDQLIEQREHELEQLAAHDEARARRRGDEHGTSTATSTAHGRRRPGGKAKLVRLIELTVKPLPGNNYEFTQPIQMRFNELISGVRSDVAVKVYGDDFEQMQRTANADRRACCADVPGAADVKVEQTEGLPMMNVDDRPRAIARYGLNVADVQDVVAAAVGGREAGQVFEGDRRFDLVVRLPETVRCRPRGARRTSRSRCRTTTTAATAGSSPRPTRSAAAGVDPPGVRPARRRWRRSRWPKGRTRSAARTASGGSSCRRTCAAATSARSSTDAQPPDRRARSSCPPATGWTGAGSSRTSSPPASGSLIVVPVCFFLIFLLLFSTFNSVKYAVMVFTGVPLALTGGIVALWLRDMPFSHLGRGRLHRPLAAWPC